MVMNVDENAIMNLNGDVNVDVNWDVNAIMDVNHECK